MPNNFYAGAPNHEQLFGLSRRSSGLAHGLWHADATATFGKVTASSGMDVAVASVPAASAIVNGTANAAYAGGTVTIAAQHATLYRRDVVWINSSGNVAAASGSNAASAASAAAPLLASAGTRLGLADILVKPTSAGGGTIASGDITDIRQQLSGMRYVDKTANQTVASATLTNDTHLFFSIGPSEKWTFAIFLNTAGGVSSADGFKYTLTVPSGGIFYTLAHLQATGATSHYAAQGSGTVTFTTPGFAVGCVVIQGWVLNSTTAGTVQLQWACQSAGSDTVSGGTANLNSSYLLATRVA